MKDKRYYPILLDLSNQRCLVIGGGSVATRKVYGLLNAYSNVTIVSPVLSNDLKKLVDDNSVQWIKSEYRKEYLTEASLVIGSTDSQEVNMRISIDAKAAGILVNIVDEPENCTFILPAICKKGDIQIAVSTSGAAPGISAYIRDKIDSFIGYEYEALVDVLKNLRSRIKNIQQNSRKHFWQRVKKLDIPAYRNNPDSLIELINTWVEEAETNNQPE